ncbi:MAG: AraC family transcriptional regulator, partial [Oscillospiraceae bacterium]|nr:AraC family transcriptional regulator [Oscillospiraceae bacterium]
GGVTHRHRLSAGQGFLICPGQVNTYCADEEQPWKYVWVEFDGLRAADYLDAAGLGQSQPVYRPQTPPAGEELRDRMLYIANHANASSLHLVGHLCLFLDELVQSSATRREKPNGPLRDFYIQEAVAFIQQNYQRDITVEEIAGICKLNRSYFSKLFKDVIGCTPQEFIIRLRLTKAAEQMRSTNDAIGDIARRCGYPNQLHFSQAFKKRYGLSPREWRKENKPVRRE